MKKLKAIYELRLIGKNKQSELEGIYTIKPLLYEEAYNYERQGIEVEIWKKYDNDQKFPTLFYPRKPKK